MVACFEQAVQEEEASMQVLAAFRQHGKLVIAVACSKETGAASGMAASGCWGYAAVSYFSSQSGGDFRAKRCAARDRRKRLLI